MKFTSVVFTSFALIVSAAALRDNSAVGEALVARADIEERNCTVCRECPGGQMLCGCNVSCPAVTPTPTPTPSPTSTSTPAASKTPKKKAKSGARRLAAKDM